MKNKIGLVLVFFFLLLFSQCRKNDVKLNSNFTCKFEIGINKKFRDSCKLSIKLLDNVPKSEISQALGKLFLYDLFYKKRILVADSLDLSTLSKNDSIKFIINTKATQDYRLVFTYKYEMNEFTKPYIDSVQVDFSALGFSKPEINFNIDNVSYDSVQLSYKLGDNGGFPFTYCGFLMAFYKPYLDPLTLFKSGASSARIIYSDLNKTKIVISPLPQQEHTVWAFVITKGDTFFTLPQFLKPLLISGPNLKVKQVDSITAKSVKLSFEYLKFNGNDEISFEGVAISKNSNCANSNFVPATFSKTLNYFDVKVNSYKNELGVSKELYASTVYFFKGVSRNSGGYGYSAVQQFTTMAASTPVISILNSSGASNTAVTISIGDFGGSKTATWGVVYSAFNTLPTVSETLKQSVSSISINNKQFDISGLTSGAMYYYRGFITTSFGTVYTNVIFFRAK